MSDEAENLTLRVLRKIQTDVADVRANMATRSDLDAARADSSDLRRDVSEGFATTTGALTALAGRMGKVEDHLADLRGLVLDTRAQMATHADVEALGRRLDVEAHATGERISALEARVADIERRLPKQ